MDDFGSEPPSFSTFLDRYRRAREAAAATLSSAAPPNTSPSSAPSTPRRVPAASSLAPPLSLSLSGTPASPAPHMPASPGSPSATAGSAPVTPTVSPRRVAVDKNVWGPVFHPLGRSVQTAKRYDGVDKPPGSGESTSELHDQQKLFPLYPQKDDE